METAPAVRPWNELSRATSPERPGVASRANLIAASFASVPLLQKKARERPGERHEPLGQLALRRLVEEVRDVEEVRRLGAERLHEARVAVAEGVDRDAGEEVPVDLPVGVDEPGAPRPSRGWNFVQA